jgi:hypothetical protein
MILLGMQHLQAQQLVSVPTSPECRPEKICILCRIEGEFDPDLLSLPLVSWQPPLVAA